MTRHVVTTRDLAEAIERGQTRTASEFRAESVRYRPEEDAIEIVTKNAGGFLVPRQWIEPLRSIHPQDLSRMEVWAGGSAFELPDQDVHVSVHGLLVDALPKLIPQTMLATLFARQGGKATSAAKSASARQNGGKGGRPRKASVSA